MSSVVKDRETYKRDDLVGVLDDADQEYLFSIYRLSESVKSSYTGSRAIQAVKFVRDSENENQYTASEEESTIEVSRILRRALKISEGTIEEDGVEKSMVVISRKMTTALTHIAKSTLESDSSEEGEEESSRNYGIGKRNPKGQSRSIEAHDDESEIRERSQIEEHDDESSQNGSNPQAKLKRKKGRKSKKEAENKVPKQKEPKPQKPPKLPKVKKIVEYKRGKFNIRIKEIEIDERREGTSKTVYTDCCDICSNREVFRAVNTDDVELLTKVLHQHRNNLTSVFQNWGCDDCLNAVELSIIRGNPDIINLILDEMNTRKIVTEGQRNFYKTGESFGIVTIDTGYNDKYAYGVATRKVALGRGNREGVNALCADEVATSNENHFEEISSYENYSCEAGFQRFWSNVMRFLTVDIFKKLISMFSSDREGFHFYFAEAVRSGNVELAAFTADMLIKFDGYGLNDLHHKSLISKDSTGMQNVRAASTKKKTLGGTLIPPIFCAAINPNLAVFEHLYQILDEKFIRDEKSSSVIFYAALNKNHEILEYLLNQGAEFREANKEKMTPLMVAAKYGRHSNVELLLKKGDLSKKKNRDGFAPIHFAALGNYTKVIEVLIENGADIDLPGKDRMTALAIASSRGHYETVKFLLEKGAKTIKKDKFKRTPLILALKNSHARVASLLLAHGCPHDEPDSSDNYPIHYACAYGCIDAIDILMKAGADANCYNSWKLTPVAVAMLKNHFEIINKLLEYPNIDINCKDDNGRTLLSNSIRNINEKSVLFVEMIIMKHNADITIPDLKGNTPLHHLCHIQSTGFIPISIQTVQKLTNINAIRDEAAQIIGWFIKLAGLLSGNRIDMWSIKNFEPQSKTALEIYFTGITQVFEHNLNIVNVVPNTSQYDSQRNRNVQTPVNLHSYLYGHIELQRQKHSFVIRLLELLSGYWRESNTQQSGTKIVNELSGEKENKSLEFSLANEGILRTFIDSIARYHFFLPPRDGLQMQYNESKELSLKEFVWLQKLLEDQKTAVVEIVNIIVSNLSINTSGSETTASAGESMVNCFSNRWKGLFLVPLQNKSAIGKLQAGDTSNTTNPNSAGSLFSFGYPNNPQPFQFGFNTTQQARNNFGNSFGNSNFRGANTSFNNNSSVNSNYLDLESTGVDKEVYERMKEFRRFQIKIREELTTDLIDIITRGQRSSNRQNWKDRHRFCKSIMSSIPNLLFINSVESLSLNTYEDAEYVLKSCKEMVHSSYVLGKKLIDLARPAESEIKARVFGQDSSLLKNIVDSLGQVFARTSSYVDISGSGTSEAIVMFEIEERLKFVEWLIEQLKSDLGKVKEIEDEVRDEIEKLTSQEKEIDKVRIEKSRRIYQRSISAGMTEINTTSFKTFACFINTYTSSQNKTSIKYKVKSEIEKQCLSILHELFSMHLSFLDINFVPYVKQSLLLSASSLITDTYSNLPTVSSVVNVEPEIIKRPALQSEVVHFLDTIIPYRLDYRSKILKLISDLLNRTRGKVPADSEVTSGDYGSADKITRQNYQSTSLWIFIHSVTIGCLQNNTISIYNSFLLQLHEMNKLDLDLGRHQRRECTDVSDFLTSIIQSELFTDFKLDQFTMGSVIQIFINILPTLFTINENSLLDKKTIDLVKKTKINVSKLIQTLLVQIYSKTLDKTKAPSDVIEKKLQVSHFDPQMQVTVIMKKELIDLAVEESSFPLYTLIDTLTQSPSFSIFSFLSISDYHYGKREVEELEQVRCSLVLKIIDLSLDVYDIISRPSFLGLTAYSFKWPQIIQSLLCVHDRHDVISNHELPEKNNDQRYLELIDLVNSQRKDMINSISDVFIQKFELKKTDQNNKFVLEHLYSVYRSKGWSKVAHDILIGIFERFFEIFGDPSVVTLPKIKNPLFAFAANPNFESIGWRKTQRIDFPFFEYLFSKCSNPNVLFRFVKDNKDYDLSLFDEGFTARNSNFLRALLQRPNYNPVELFSSTEKDRLHYGLRFIQSEEDVEFLRVFVDKIKIDELILENRLNGYTPFLRYISQQQINDKNDFHFVKTHQDVFTQVLDILVNAGCNTNAVYHDEAAIKLEIEEKIENKNKHRELRSGLHLHLVKKPSYKIFQYLLQVARIDPNKQDQEGCTVLHMLTHHYQKETEIFDLLFEAKADLNISDTYLETPIYDIVNTGNLELLKTFVDAGASLEVINKEEKSPLTIFIEAKNIEGIEFLIKLGADVNFNDRFLRNSLHWAINFADHTANSSFEIEDILIRNGVEINRRDLLGRTPLHYPFVKVNDFTVTFLVDPIESVNSLLSKKNLRVDEPDVLGNTPLMYASQRGSLVSALYLVDKEADLNLKNIEGNNSLAIAMISKHDHLAITLLNKGADWNTQVNIYNLNKRIKIYNKVMTMVREEMGTASRVDEEKVKSFIRGELDRRDVEEEEKDPQFNEVTRMHAFKWAIRNNWQGLAYMILSRGYDIGKAVYDTIEEGKFNYTFTLLTKKEENEPYLFVGEEGDNIAHLTCYRATQVKKDLLEKIFRVLVKKGISLSSKNNKGHTSLHCAAVCGSVETISFLLELKIDPDVKDKDQRTPMMLAAQNKNFEALKLLLEHTKDKREVDSQGKNIMHYLCEIEGVEDQKLSEYISIVSSQVSISVTDNRGKVPLHYLMKRGNSMIKSCLKLIDLSPNIDLLDHRGQSILTIALKSGAAPEIIERLISLNANTNMIDEYGRTPLGLLITETSKKYTVDRVLKLIDLMVNKGLNINKQASFLYEYDPQTLKPIYRMLSPVDYLLAKESLSYEKASHLLKLRAKLDLPNGINRKSFELVLINKPENSYIYALNILLNSHICNENIDCNFTIPLKTGVYKDREFSGLCYIMKQGCSVEHISELVRRGNDINRRDGNGISAFSFAISERLFQYVPSMIESQALSHRILELDIKIPKMACIFDQNPKLTTPLNYSIKYNQLNVVQSLIMNGCNRNFSAEDQKPPGYYLIKYWLNSENFAIILKNFMHPDKYTIEYASGRRIPRFDFNFQMAMKRKVALDKEEEYMVDPLYFAVFHNAPIQNLFLLLQSFPSLNYINPYDSHSAFSLAITKNIQSAKLILKLATFEMDSMEKRMEKMGTSEDKRTPAQKKINLNLPYTVTIEVLKETKTESFLPLNSLYSAGVKISNVVRAIRHGADFNIKDPLKNQNLIMLAILENDYDLIKEISTIERTGKCVPFDSSVVDVLGRTPIHLVVNSHKNGSFENVNLLKLLLKYYDVNKKDKNGYPPSYYASLQDSGVMLDSLLNLGAQEYEIPFGVRRAPTSLISFATFPASVPDYENDSEVFIKSKEQQYKEKLMLEIHKVEMDKMVPHNIKNTSKLCLDDNCNPYDVYMTKVDIQKGQYSGSVFYRMQLLHETNRDVYIVFTRYGRIGDNGQHQITFFANKPEAITEFANIFKSKSGNDWSNIENFQRLKKKYKLVRIRNETEKENLIDFYDEYHEKDLVESSMNERVKEILKEVVSAKKLFAQVNELRVDISKLPLSRLNKTDLMQAMTLLNEMKKLAEELKQEREVEITNSDPDKIFDLLDEISEMTSEYYELIPSTNYKTKAIPPLENINGINAAVMTVRGLLEVEVAVKILLGARQMLKEIHPIEYCYNSLNIKLMELDEQSVEKSAILDYMAKTMNYGHPESVDIFALERKGENERFQKHLKTKNRKLLWHGSRTMNFIGILNKGLKIAPPEAPPTGHMFGKGIYFSDSFSKSYNYTDTPLHLIILCEVALGKSLELKQATYINNLQEGYQSVLGLGINTPDPNKDVVIPNGMILPLGKIIQRNNESNELSLGSNEYVVYNEDQVKIRYLVAMRR